MITRVRDIVSHDPYGETWKHLRLFLRIDATVDKLRQLHKVPKGKHESNLQKQAMQIGYCLRQAQEYFQSSARVELATRPLLLYYGCVSLSQALVLLKKDGTFSLDASRKSGKHSHHGLDLDKGLAERAAKVRTFQDFYGALQCECHRNAKGEVSGHFPLMYQCLEPGAFIVHSEYHDSYRSSYMERDQAVACADLQSVDRVTVQRFNCLELLRTLPDLYNSLTDAGVEPAIRPGSIKRTVMNHYSLVSIKTVNNSTPGAKAHEYKFERLEDTFHFFINDLSDTDKKTFLALYQKNPEIRVESEFPNNLHLVRKVKVKAGSTTEPHTYFPAIVDDLHGKKYFILSPDSYLSELAAMLVLTYCLGMLSRYFPDVWMTATDSRVEIAELTNTLLSITHRKFPNLILDQMMETKHYMHN